MEIIPLLYKDAQNYFTVAIYHWGRMLTIATTERLNGSRTYTEDDVANAFATPMLEVDYLLNRLFE